MQLSVPAVLALGFLLGLRHALDADHVAAIAALSGSDEAGGDGPGATRAGLRRSLRNGLWWGIGHALTLGAAGGVALALRVAIPPRLAEGFEFLVAVMLIVLGAAALRSAARTHLHAHQHRHGGSRHTHLHFHARGHDLHDAPAALDATGPHASSVGGVPHDHPHPERFALRPFVVGCVHGLAGSAALALLVLAAMPTLLFGIVYLLIFGAGSIAGMGMMSLILGAPLVLARRRAQWMSRGLRAAAGVASLGLGLMLAWELGINGTLLR